MILITGSPRSGTGYAAQILCRQGLSVGHEKVRDDGISAWQWCVFDDEYPWMLQRRRNYAISTVLHQVRNPLKVIASLSVLRDVDWAFISKHVNMDYCCDDLERRCTFWLEWTQMADMQAKFRYRVEDIEKEWPRIFRVAGGWQNWTPAAESQPRDYNTRKHEGLTWPELLQSDLGEQVAKRAMLYGYEVTA
jgi:hypothetical protein